MNWWIGQLGSRRFGFSRRLKLLHFFFFFCKCFDWLIVFFNQSKHLQKKKIINCFEAGHEIHTYMHQRATLSNYTEGNKNWHISDGSIKISLAQATSARDVFYIQNVHNENRKKKELTIKHATLQPTNGADLQMATVPHRLLEIVCYR